MNERIAVFLSAAEARWTEPEKDHLTAKLREESVLLDWIMDEEQLAARFAEAPPALFISEFDGRDGWPGKKQAAAARDEGVLLPVLLVGSISGGEAAVKAFASGANEYMPVPLHQGELICRILNLLQLSGRRSRKGLLRVDALLLDPGRRQVSREGRDIPMTPKEFDLLYFLAEREGAVCSREDILREVWGYQFQADTNVVDVYIRHIRLKVDKGFREKLIHTRRGSGYMMKAPVWTPS